MVRLLLVGLALLLTATDAHAQFGRFRRPYSRPAWRYPRYPWSYPYPYPYPYPMPYYYPVPAYMNPYAPQPPATGTPATEAAPAPKDNRATIQIALPSSAADVWVDGHKMVDKLDNQRVYVSPPLEPGHDYVYTVKARWVHLLNDVTQERTVVVRANEVATVDFTQPPPK